MRSFGLSMPSHARISRVRTRLSGHCSDLSLWWLAARSIASRYQGDCLLRASRLAERSTSSVSWLPSTSSTRLRPSRPPFASPYLYVRWRWDGVFLKEYFMGITLQDRVLQPLLPACRTAQ